MADFNTRTRKTIGDVLDENRGLGPGFDFLRVGLALSIVAWHSGPVANGSNWLDKTPIVWLPGYAMLVMFFGLSGFLIAGSALRLSLSNFLVNRGLRIFPALILEIALSAFLLGPIFTALPLSEYFSRLQTYHYLTNIVGFMQYHLPGVFASNPSNLVNWALWTVPYEFGCYAIMSAFIVFGTLRSPKLIIALVVGYMATGLVLSAFHLDAKTTFGAFSESIFTGRGSRMLVSFTLGIVAYLYRARIPYSRRLFAAAVGTCFVISLARPAPWITYPLLNLILGIPLVYVMAFVGATRIPKLPIFGTGDYSYGIYLYGVPIQQAVRAALPFTNTATLNLLFAVPLITLFAMFSWFGLERPILKARKKFSFVARARGVGDHQATVPIRQPSVASGRAGETS